VNATVRAADRAGAAEAAAAAAEAGFRCVKLKVGIGDDAGRVAAVRAAAGDAMAIRVDANGAWPTVDEALAHLRALAPAGIELCEEPVHGIEAMRALRARSPVPLAMDETAAERGAPGAGAADAVCLKVGRCGGISGVLRDARAARAAGTKVYVASNFDGPLGIAAGLHAAAGLRASGPVGYCGLATLGAFAGFEDVLAPVRGAVSVPSGPGLVGGVGGLSDVLAGGG
jgi:L-alanine-DL-glutamate epimerase-like enolase superfamily enzyme